MSRCRCDDIQNCKARKRKLSHLLERITPYRAWYNTIDNKVDELRNYEQMGIENISQDIMQQKMENLHVDMEVMYRNTTSKLNAAVESCQREISDMQSEDTAYHEEQRRLLEERLAQEKLAQENALKTNSQTVR